MGSGGCVELMGSMSLSFFLLTECVPQHSPPNPRTVSRFAGVLGSGVSGFALSQVVTLCPMLPPAVADRKPPSPVGKAPDGLSSLHGLPIPASTS